MVLFEPPNLTAGIDEAVISTADSVSAFPVMLLMFIFFLVLLGGSANQKRRTNYADYPMWATMAGLSTSFVALIMTLKEGIIDITVLGIVVATTLISALWFLLSKNRGEL